MCYQISEYDCGYAALANAIARAANREEVPARLVRRLHQLSCDELERGTSASAMRQFVDAVELLDGCPLRAMTVTGNQCSVRSGGPIVHCVEHGGSAVLNVWSGGEGHYVTAVGTTRNSAGVPCLEIADPYLKDPSRYGYGSPDPDVAYFESGDGHRPCLPLIGYNVAVPFERLNRSTREDYAMINAANRGRYDDPDVGEAYLFWKEA